MKNLRRVVTLAALCVSVAASGQQLPGGSAPGLSAPMTKLFGSNTNFTAKSDVRVLDKNQKETMSAVMNFAMLDGKMRTEIDLSQMKSADLPPAVAERMKQMGIDKVVSIVRPDKKVMYMLYPGMKSYATMPLPKEEAVWRDKESKMEKTALGKEAIDGHPCVKNRVILTSDKGDKHETTLWNASDLKDFPVQIQATEKGNTVLLRYKDVQFAAPDAKQFEPPADYTPLLTGGEK